MIDIKDAEIKLSRIDSTNRLGLINDLPPNVYFVIDEENYYTFAAFYQNASGKYECAGVVQFVSWGTHGPGSIAEVKYFGIYADNRRDNVKKLLLHELMNICRKCSISEIGISSFPGDNSTRSWILANGFKITEREMIHVFTTIRALTDNRVDCCASKIPANYACPIVKHISELSKEQLNQLIKKFNQDDDPSVKNLSAEIKKNPNLTGFILQQKDREDVDGAVIASYTAINESKGHVYHMRFLRLFTNDRYGVLVLCDRIIKDAYRRSGDEAYIYIDTAYKPGISLMKFFIPDTPTYTEEYGIMKIKR